MNRTGLFSALIIASFIGCEEEGARNYLLPRYITAVRIEVAHSRSRVEIRPSAKKRLISVEGNESVQIDSTFTISPNCLWDLDRDFDPEQKYHTLMIRDPGLGNDNLIITLDSTVALFLAITSSSKVTIGDWGSDVGLLAHTTKDSVVFDLGNVSGRLDFLNCGGKTMVYGDAVDSLDVDIVSGRVGMIFPRVNEGYLLSRSDGNGGQVYLHLGTVLGEFLLDMDFPVENSAQEVEIDISDPVPGFRVSNIRYESFLPVFGLRREQQEDSSLIFDSFPL